MFSDVHCMRHYLFHLIGHFCMDCAFASSLLACHIPLDTSTGDSGKQAFFMVSLLIHSEHDGRLAEQHG
jgi:hypothetical protein